MAGRMRWRAALVVGAAWAVIWAAMTPLFLALLPILAPRFGFSLPGNVPLAALLVGALVAGSLGMAIRGALTGAAFALLLSRVERGHTVDELSTGRLVLWANLIGLLWTVFNIGVVVLVAPNVPFMWPIIGASMLAHALIVTVCALVTTWLVRRGARASEESYRLTGPDALGSLPAGEIPAHAPTHRSSRVQTPTRSE